MNLEELRAYHDKIKEGLDMNIDENRYENQFGGMWWSDKSEKIYEEEVPRFRSKLISYINDNIENLQRRNELIEKAKQKGLIYRRSLHAPIKPSPAENILDELQSV